MIVRPIPVRRAYPFIINKHYAMRIPPISYAYGLIEEKELIGIVTYGVPSSSNLRSGICGKEWSDKVLELNRVCCKNVLNMASTLIGRSLALLPKPTIVVSYADTKMNHFGCIYQATNFIYTGLSTKRTDWKLKGHEHLHGATIADISRGKEHRAEWMRDKFGEDFYLEERSRKHRYIYFCGNKRQKRNMRDCLLYEIQPYPKGDKTMYDIDQIKKERTNIEGLFV